jgi:hypothetical protein
MRELIGTPGNYSAAFLKDEFLVGGLGADMFYLAARPTDGDGIDAGGSAQSEVEAGVAGTFKAAVGADLVVLLEAPTPAG